MRKHNIRASALDVDYVFNRFDKDRDGRIIYSEVINFYIALAFFFI